MREIKDEFTPDVKPSNLGQNVDQLKLYSPTQVFFLMRLSYMQRQRAEITKVIPSTDWRMRLINKAMYSTFEDCQREGVGSEARNVLASTASQANNANS